MAQQYENKLSKERNRGMTREGQIDAKLREAKMKKVEEYEKNNPRGKANMQYKL